MVDTPVAAPVGVVSSGAAGVEGNAASSSPAFSPDGNQIVFVSSATNLVAGDTDAVQDVFIKNLTTGAVQLASFDSVTGLKGNGSSYNPVFSPDGTKVAFSSLSTDFAPADNNGQYGYDIFVKNLVTGRVTLASAAADGTASNDTNATPVFSPDGTKVLFYSLATNLSPSDPNNAGDFFLKDLTTGAVTLVSVNGSGTHGAASGYAANFSPDGTKVVFSSLAALTPDDTNNRADIFVRDLTTGSVTLVSRNALGVEGNNSSYSTPVFSPDGTKIAFGSTATNLAAGGTAAGTSLFVKDLNTGAVILVSANAAGVQANGTSFDPSFSPDGTMVLFDSYASNLVSGDTNGQPDIFVKDLTTGAVTLVSTNAAGTEGNAFSRYAVFSPNGAKIAWQSNASNLVPGDTNGASDVFVASFPLPAPNTAPVIGGTVANQAATDKATVAPFSTATVVDPDAGQTETVTVTYAAANGTLSGGGFTGAAGSYSASFASAAAAQTALQALVFTPTANEVAPGATVTTGFTVAVSDGTATTTNTGASVVTTSVNDAPTVSGASAGQADAAGSPIRPFSTVTVADPDVGQTETVTVSFAAANGTLSGGGFTGSNGVYSVSGTAAQVTADLQAVVFIPTAGQSGVSTLTIAVSDGTATTTDATTSVVATAAPAPNTAPLIGGTLANQTDAAGVVISPFSTVTVTDPDAGQTEGVTVSFTAANGTLSGGGFVQTAPGVYAVSAASAAAAQADLRAATFSPTAGQSATTAFTVSVSDGQATATDSATSVVATYTAPASGGGGSGTIVPPSVQYGLLTEFQDLERALAGGADALTPGTPISAAFQAEKAVAAQLDAGQLTLAQAEAALQHLVDGTTAVAVASYGFFTGATPTAAGLNYLVHSAANATDLNDAYYARFSTENRYINFAANLATGPGAGAAAFQAAYGALSLADATAKAYLAVFGTVADAAKVSALLNTLVPDGLGGQETRATYFAQYGGDGPNGQGTKAAMIGFLLSNAVHDGSGVYGAATEHYLAALAHGAAPAGGSELALHYGPDVNLVGSTPSLDPTIAG